MWKPLLLILFIAFVSVTAIYWLFSLPTESNPFKISTIHIVGKRHYVINERDKRFTFDLIDPESAPPEIHNQVMRGYQIFIETPKYVPDYVGDRLACENCHIGGGNTLGNKNGGISLVGVTAVYPMYSARNKIKISLKDRINSCFMRSMNGKPLPENCSEMNDIITYLEWISQEVLRIGTYPWLGLPKLQTNHQADATQGALIYQNNCTFCHQLDGQGATGIPPLWGDHCFNKGAGLNDLQTLASFIWYNMPYQQPILTKEQALDVAAYLITRPRPHFDPN